MKRSAYLLFVLVLLLILSACGGESEAPKSLIEMEIEDFIYINEYNDCSSYSYEVSHNFDSASNIDYATIELRIEYPYAVIMVTGEFSYQYIKSDDYWELDYNYSGWGSEEFTVNEKAYIGTHKGTFNNWDRSNSYTLKIEDFDMKSQTVTCSYDITVQVTDGKTTYVTGRGTYEMRQLSANFPIYIKDEGTFVFRFDKSAGVYGSVESVVY